MNADTTPPASLTVASTSSTTRYRDKVIKGCKVFYREAGAVGAPVVVLLHGFPSSSRMFEGLIPLLATRFHVIAPDYPGFGLSNSLPPPLHYDYTFENIAKTIDGLLEALGLERYTLYMQDYGGPVGFRIMLAHPERVHGLVVQNANAYREGLGDKWAGIQSYWADPKSHPEELEVFMSLQAARRRHLGSSPNPDRYNPDTWRDEDLFLNRTGQKVIQGSLLYDYRTNVAAYPQWQAWLRAHQPPTLVLWGRWDPSFLPAGAEAYRRDLPGAEIHLLDAGHFALDEKTDEIATRMIDFIERLG